MLVDGAPQRACLLAAQDVGARAVTTIEGLAPDGTLHPVQLAWLAESVPQRGYCQAGQMMCTVALLRATPKPTDAQIDDALGGQLWAPSDCIGCDECERSASTLTNWQSPRKSCA